jgi:hypothetical protein
MFLILFINLIIKNYFLILKYFNILSNQKNISLYDLRDIDKRNF